MPDGRMFGMIHGEAGNAGCGFRMPEMLDAGRCLEMPEEPECLERAGRARMPRESRKSLRLGKAARE